MFKNLSLMALRNFKHQKIHFLITMTGLATGLSVAFFCTMYVIHELQYDQHHKKKDRIYRMITRTKDSGTHARTPVILKETLENEFPEIETVVQISENWQPCCIQKDNQLNREEPEIYADPEIFQIFNIPLLYGDAKTCLNQPNSVVISEKIAQKYFSAPNSMNQILKIKVGEQFESFIITGILRHNNQGSFLKPEILLPKQVMLSLDLHNFMKDWNGSNPQTYVLLNTRASAEAFRRKLPAFSERCIEKGYQGHFDIQPLKKMHLYSQDIWGNLGETGSINIVIIFTAIGLVILSMACINYINLSTAQSAKRATEIGIRKVIGASRNQIRLQVLIESILITIIVLPVAFGLLEVFLPFGNQLVHRKMDMHILHDFIFMAVVVTLTLLVGFISGSYNAFYVSRLNTVDVVRSKTKIQSSRSVLRKGLLLFQFCIFCGLIVCSLTMFRQIYYIQHKQLGYNKDQLLSLNLPANFGDSRILTFKNEVLNLAGVKHASVSSFVPPAIGNWLGTEIPDPKTVGKTLPINYILSDPDYCKTVELELDNGRNNSDQMANMTQRQLILNESAVHLLDIVSPIGHKIKMWGGEWEIIGLIHDFHTHSLHNKIPALFFFSTDKLDNPFFNQFLSHYAIRLESGNIPETLQSIERVWHRLFPNVYFDYRFADEEFDRVHRDDRHLSQLLMVFTVTAILINCMGLFGLILMTVQNRIREIGIRKTLGATILQIFTTLTREYFLVFGFSVVISIPIAAYFMTRWLHQFAYQANIGLMTYASAVGLAFLIILLTTCWQTLRAAKANLVESLRYE